MIQTRFDRRNTCFDDFIIIFTSICSCFVAILSCFVDGRLIEDLHHCVDCLICGVNGCMQTQQDVEIKHLQAIGYYGAPSYALQVLPAEVQQVVVVRAPDQQEMRSMNTKRPSNQKY